MVHGLHERSPVVGELIAIRLLRLKLPRDVIRRVLVEELDLRDDEVELAILRAREHRGAADPTLT
jgi:hypothetical protein